ncbi:type II toxin-antitoxin system VapC family toxin [Dongia sp.]|uniref:type II toxin-antitoxin system VapC family toxin n=1 Tax=Dongia sp. TaxID=1977262 RepID=UPI0035AF666F
MSTFCLDTSVIEPLTTGRHPLSSELREWFDRNEKLCFISAVSHFEMAFGTLRLAVRKSEEDRIRAHRISVISKFFLLKMGPRTIEINATILAHAAGLRVLAERLCGDIGACDAIIAASAELAGHVLVSMNVKHFAATGVRVVDASRLLNGEESHVDVAMSRPSWPLDRTIVH